MEQRVWSTCQRSIDPSKPLPRQTLPLIRSLIVNSHTSDSILSSLLETLTRSLRLTTSSLLRHHTLHLLTTLASHRPHFAPQISSSIRSLCPLSADSLAALASIADSDRTLKLSLEDPVFASLCFNSRAPARIWLLRNGGENLGVGPHVLLTVCLGFTKDPYPYTREAALDGLVDLCKNGVVSEDVSVIEGCYCCAVELLNDDVDCVRSAAIRAVSAWGRMLVAVNQEKDKIDWSDAVFLQLCSMVRDMSVGVRIEAFDALGTSQMVSEDILLQSLSKKVLKIMKDKKSNGQCTAEKFDILTSSAAGAFVHGLEDEFYEVRKSACYSLHALSVLSAEFAGQAVNLLMDILNDDSMVVRTEALETLYHMATFDCLKVQEIHRHMFLGTLVDNNDQIRSAARKIFKAMKFPNLDLFRLSIDSLLENLEIYPQDEADVFSVLFYMGKRHGNFAALIIRDVSQEIEPVSEGKLSMDNARVAAFLVLGISVPLLHDRKNQRIPSRLFSYAVTLLGRISCALNDIVDQNTLLTYLCQCSRSSNTVDTEVGGEELVHVVDDDFPSSICIEGNSPGGLPSLQIDDRKSEGESLISPQSRNVVALPVESQLEEHDEVMTSMNLILAKVKDTWMMVKSSCTNEALRTLRACKEELAMLSSASHEFAGVVAFMLHYVQVVKLLAKIWEHIMWKVQSIQMVNLEIAFGKLDKRLREMRCRFIGFSKEEELHILELILVACILRLSKVEVCCYRVTLEKLSAAMSCVECLSKEGSVELSNFMVEVRKTLNDIGKSVGDTFFCPFLFAKFANLFSLEQFNLGTRIRQIHAELDVLDNDSANPLPFVSGLPVAICLKITLHNVLSENRLWLTMKMNEQSTQYFFIDLNLVGICGEVKKFPLKAPFYGTPKAGSFTLRVCIGMECLSDDVHLVKSHGGPKRPLVDLCQEKEIYLRLVQRDC